MLFRSSASNAANRLPSLLTQIDFRAIAENLRRNPDVCPVCNNNTVPVSKSLITIKASSKVATLVIDAWGNSAEMRSFRSNQLVKRHCSSITNYVSIVPSKPAAGDVISPRISMSYTCGSTFEVTVARRHQNEALSTT